MTDFLVASALKRIWVNPSLDNQLIINPTRVTPVEGAFNNYKVMWTNYIFPTSDRYHVFVIGNVSPLALGLFDSFVITNPNQWYSLMEASNNSNMLTDLYTDSGIQLPRHEALYTRGINNDLILIIKDNANIPINYTNVQIYLRVYTNSYFYTAEALAAGGNGIKVVGMTISKLLDISTMLSSYNYYNSLNGYIKAFVNGFYVDNITNIVIGNTVEFVYDSSVYKHIEFTLGNLFAFNSVLDSKHKYLLHYQDDHYNEIEFFDDNDIFIIDRTTGLSYGTYYHRNSVDAVRMVTHRDYSIVSDYVTNYISTLQTNAGTRVINQSNLIVKVIFRQSSYARPLFFENNRIHDLYKLTDSLVLQNLTGNGLSNWFAPTLENSDYIKLMSSNYRDITLSLVETALGYNATSILMGNTPLVPYNYNAGLQIDLPYGLQSYATAYEYDSNGLFLGDYQIVNSINYVCNNSTCTLVEVISGTATNHPDVRLGITDILVPVTSGYKVYKCHLNTNGLPNNIYTDITDTTEYVINNNILSYTGLDTNQFLMIRTDAKFLAYNISLPMSLGNFKFTLTENQTYNGITNNVIMSVPMGEMDIFLNGHALIPGLDYFINFPNVVITNTTFLNNPNSVNQIIHVRFTGFCKSDMTLQDFGDTGFIVNGTLSANNRYDIRDDKVLHVVVNGSVISRNSAAFAEDVSVGNVVLNGLPYQVKDIVVPLKNPENISTYAYKALADTIDTEVINYLNTVLPQVENLALPTINQKYVLSSPFLAAIINDMLNGTISTTLLSTSTTDVQILVITKPYEVWLAYDPTQAAININKNYVTVCPTPANTVISLNLFQYRFLLSVIRLYCNGLVNVSQYITLV